MPKTSNFSALKKLLSKPKDVVIVTHWSPDGDAMGSSLGLYNYLKNKKHSVTVIVPNDYPDFLNWLHGNNKVVNASVSGLQAAKKIKAADIIFCLDFNSLSRIGELGKEIAGTTAVKVIIDHHQQPEDFADYLLHNVKSSSTCELIYDFIQLMGDTKKIDKKIAECLYTGIMTDTGSFRFPSTSAKTLKITAALVEAGANNSEIHNRIFDDNTEDRLKLLGHALVEKMVVLKEYNAAYISLSNEELSRFNFKKGDTEGLVNYPLSIRGIKFSVFIVEKDGIIKMSFRSKGKFDVNTFARQYFSGGGHKNAAGGASNLSLEATVNKFLGTLPLYKKELIGQ